MGRRYLIPLYSTLRIRIYTLGMKKTCKIGFSYGFLILYPIYILYLTNTYATNTLFIRWKGLLKKRVPKIWSATAYLCRNLLKDSQVKQKKPASIRALFSVF